MLDRGGDPSSAWCRGGVCGVGGVGTIDVTLCSLVAQVLLTFATFTFGHFFQYLSQLARVFFLKNPPFSSTPILLRVGIPPCTFISFLRTRRYSNTTIKGQRERKKESLHCKNLLTIWTVHQESILQGGAAVVEWPNPTLGFLYGTEP